jgi:hypothetical protein
VSQFAAHDSPESATDAFRQADQGLGRCAPCHSVGGTRDATHVDGLAGAVLSDVGPDTEADDPLADGGAVTSLLQAAAASSEVILLAGIQDVSNALVSDFKLNDVLRIILETMYRAKGFKNVILCIRDGRSNSMLGRFGFGPNAQEIARRFRFSLVFAPDIFHAALANGVDILISDTNDPKIAARIPAWFRKAVTPRPSSSFRSASRAIRWP